ncbi:GLL7 protein, partial [Steatornis caripensis]|nr:GLL7 protein [Steatornis caripensis]
MRIIYQLLVLLFMMLQGAAGQPSPIDPCVIQKGYCFPGICRRPYYWIGTCHNGFSCCRRYVEV